MTLEEENKKLRGMLHILEGVSLEEYEKVKSEANLYLANKSSLSKKAVEDLLDEFVSSNDPFMATWYLFS